jgi:hypothetical protein
MEHLSNLTEAATIGLGTTIGAPHERPLAPLTAATPGRVIRRG